MALTVLFGVYAFWCFYGVLWGVSVPPWEIIPPGVSEEELVRRLIAQRKWAGVEAMRAAALCYAVTRSVLHLLAWFKRDMSN
jgi:hypothetical protein